MCRSETATRYKTCKLKKSHAGTGDAAERRDIEFKAARRGKLPKRLRGTLKYILGGQKMG